MTATELEFPGVKILVPTYFDDNRGCSAETYNHRVLLENGISTRFLVDYECYNEMTGTIRGIHFQNNPRPQVKLVRVLHGEILDFIVDLRRDSPTFKKWIVQVISSKNRKQLYLPNCYGHAYITKKPGTAVLYKFDDYYDREFARAIRWNDPEIGIEWGITDPILSEGDKIAPFLADSDVNFRMGVL